MRLSLRALGAVVAAALTLTVPAAEAAPHAGHGHGQVKQEGHAKAVAGQKQILKDVAKAERALDRALKPSRTGMLTPETLAALLANADADRAALGDVAAAAQAADGSADLAQARKDLKAVRTVNYVLVVNILRTAERRLAEVDAASVEASLLDAVVAKARTVTATSPKSLLRELRDELDAADPGDDTAGTEDPQP